MDKKRHPAQERLIKAVQREYDRVAGEIMPQLKAAGALGPDPDYNYRMLRINAAQNALRTCLESALNRMLPYDGELLVELAIRLASYAISAAPMEDQDYHVAQFMGTFADAHLRRIAEGKVIQSEWQMKDGRSQPNFPREK